MNQQNGSYEKRTVVDEGTSFKGALSSSCPIDVRGRIEGDIETPALTISASGAVHGRVKVGSVRSEGEIAGEFEADRVELAGSVKDNTVIRARSLEVRLTSEHGRLQVIFGECELSVGDEPTEHADLPVQAQEASAVRSVTQELPPEVPQGNDDSREVPASDTEHTANAADAVSAPDGDPIDDDLEIEEEDEEEAVATAVETPDRKPRRRRKGKHGATNDAPLTGWSQPPSQPPPAS